MVMKLTKEQAEHLLQELPGFRTTDPEDIIKQLHIRHIRYKTKENIPLSEYELAIIAETDPIILKDDELLRMELFQKQTKRLTDKLSNLSFLESPSGYAYDRKEKRENSRFIIDGFITIKSIGEPYAFLSKDTRREFYRRFNANRLNFGSNGSEHFTWTALSDIGDFPAYEVTRRKKKDNGDTEFYVTAMNPDDVHTTLSANVIYVGPKRYKKRFKKLAYLEKKERIQKLQEVLGKEYAEKKKPKLSTRIVVSLSIDSNLPRHLIPVVLEDAKEMGVKGGQCARKSTKSD